MDTAFKKLCINKFKPILYEHIKELKTEVGFVLLLPAVI